MSDSTPTLVLSTAITDDGYRLANPDGPEAADLLDRCKEALEPFAEAAEPIVRDSDFDPDTWSEQVCKLSVGDFRRAYEVLTQLGGRNV